MFFLLPDGSLFLLPDGSYLQVGDPVVQPSAGNRLITIDMVVDFDCGPGARRMSGPKREVTDYERRLREMN